MVLLVTLVMGGPMNLPARSSQSMAGTPLIARATQEGGTGGRAAIQIERSRPRPGLLRPECTDLPRVMLTEDIMHRVLASEVSLQRGLVRPAYRIYLGFAQDTRDPRFIQRATEIAFLTRPPAQALTVTRLWVELSPTSTPACQMQQLPLMVTGQWSEVEPMFQAQLNKVSPGQCTDVLLQLQQQMSKSSDPVDVVGVLQHIASHDM